MAHLWVKDADGQQAVFPLQGEPIDLAVSPPRCVVGRASEVAGDTFLVPVPLDAGGPPGWAVMAHPAVEVRVNGLRLATGLRLLADRDEIRVDGSASMFFSSESLARIEPFPGSERRVSCGRCRQALATGVSAVRCPNCGIWYHQTSEELPCWTYTETCAFCPQPTSMETGYQWVPED